MTDDDRRTIEYLFERVAALEEAQRKRSDFWHGFWVYGSGVAIIFLLLVVPPMMAGMWRLVAFEVGFGVLITLVWWAIARSMKRHHWDTPDNAPIHVQIVMKITGAVICMGFFAWWYFA